MTRPRINFTHNRFSQEQCNSDWELLEKAMTYVKGGSKAELCRQLEINPYSVYGLFREIADGKAVLWRPLRMALMLYVFEKQRAPDRNKGIVIQRRIRSARNKGRKRAKIVKKYKRGRPRNKERSRRVAKPPPTECIGSDELPRFDGFE